MSEEPGPETAGPRSDTRRQRRLERGPSWVDVPDTGVWRTPLVYRLFFPLVGLSFLWATVDLFDGGSDLAFTLLTAVLGLTLTIGPFLPVVKLDGATVYTRGLILHRTIAAADIAEVTPTYSGLFVRDHEDRGFTASGVGEKWNIATMLGI